MQNKLLALISTYVFRFYFPTYENDAFLCQIDDKREDEENAEISEAK